MTEDGDLAGLDKNQLAYIESYKAAVLEIFEQVKEETGYDGDLVMKITPPEKEEE